MLKKTFRIGIYGYKIHVIVAEDFALAADKYLSKIGIGKEVYESAGGLFISDSKFPWQGWILVHPDSATSTIAHESFHATCRIMSDIGSDLGNKSEEPYAYLVGDITNKVVLSIIDYEKKFSSIEPLLKEGIENDIVIEVDNK